MAFDEQFADRVRAVIGGEPGLREQRMFGGIAFMLDGNMAVGLSGSSDLMVRLGPELAEAALTEPKTRPAEMSGKRMRGFVLVGPEDLDDDLELADWVQRGVAFARSLPPKA